MQYLYGKTTRAMLADIIKNRRAVYPNAFTNQPISKATLEKILEAANWAPTHRRTEPWRFKVFHSEESRKALSIFLGAAYEKSVATFSAIKHKKIQQKPLQSGCVIAICMQRDIAASVPEWEEIASTAMAVQNMWLTAHDLGVGAYWSSPVLIQYFGEHVTLEQGERCLGFFYIGNYSGALPNGMRKTSISEKTKWM